MAQVATDRQTQFEETGLAQRENRPRQTLIDGYCQLIHNRRVTSRHMRPVNPHAPTAINTEQAPEKDPQDKHRATPSMLPQSNRARRMVATSPQHFGTVRRRYHTSTALDHSTLGCVRRIAHLELSQRFAHQASTCPCRVKPRHLAGQDNGVISRALSPKTQNNTPLRAHTSHRDRRLHH